MGLDQIIKESIREVVREEIQAAFSAVPTTITTKQSNEGERSSRISQYRCL